MTLHKDLTNSELHEQKGASTASDQQLYFANGAGVGGWKSVIETAGSWDHSTNVSSVEFTGLDNYALLQIDLIGITLDSVSSANQHILLQVGSDSGYSTSSNYFNQYWTGNGEGMESLSGFTLGYFRNNTPDDSFLNCSSSFLTNFNIARHSIVTSQEIMIGSSFTSNSGIENRLQWIREAETYNKIRITPVLSDFSGGSIIVSGYRYEV